ncbi:hypothetical protein AVI51_03755 [Piscirickettsia salmonis]|uniref:Uncharacterized protein n=1 Tax=Piscirickettsia salmonis TaxID=1238 RepID=A0A9Q5VIX7_PISSA|nr:hypothetical protein [Piscirickettsia salmonis]APS53251.1 hypothetical protein AVI51_03755 [Piscirickettsia salmonis]APS55906.1 hypothetical protein AVI52_00700 [Piscirickettsia salmonis]ERL62337.1 hypothetical protein K661_01299 [Piscirickettsia salmonis LF-89 = ATCC VR-1361]PEQ17025.1 hypothetical protein X973_04220 [Piscirickettsia salmonis]QGN77071.1 hypothetical protein Psal001_01274 [Piscirickettsia salmonis]
MRLDIYFDGTGVSLNGSNERIYGRSVVGHAFVQNKAEDVFFDPSDYSNLLSNSNTAPYQSKHCKLYFSGPVSGDSIYEGRNQFQPGRNYNPSNISEAYLSRHQSTLWSQIHGGGWKHSLQLALLATVNLITENLAKHPSEKIIINIPASYSRGAVTAIAFTSTLSEILASMGFTSEQISIGQVHTIDPVADMDYGKLEASINRPSYRNYLASVEPIRIGSFTEELFLHYAVEEPRTLFKPQLPLLFDRNFANNRPLLIPDKVKASVRFSQACHQTIAYPEYHQEERCFPAGCETFKIITGKNFPTKKQTDSTWRHFGNASNRLFSKEKRCFQDITTIINPEVSVPYSHSVLYDTYHYFMHNSNGSATFLQALTDPNNKYHNLLNWAYQNSYLSLITGLSLSDFQEQLPSQQLLAQALQCKTKQELVLLALEYKHYKQYNSQFKIIDNQLNHQDLNKLINASVSQQKDHLKQHYKLPTTDLEQYKQVAHHAINNAMLNLRPSSTKEKLFKLQSIKGLIDKTNSEERCKQLLYLAERVTQHNMGLFHFRRLGYFSKDYHAIDLATFF